MENQQNCTAKLKWEKTQYQGVVFRPSDERKYKSKPDLCYYIRFKSGGQQFMEKAGWLSEGYSALLASQLRAEKIRSHRHGELIPKEKKNPTFNEMAEIYFSWAEENVRDPNIRGRYENHLKGAIGKKRLAEIKPLDLENLKSELSKTLAPATLKHVLGMVRAVFNKAVAWGKYNGPNPIKLVKMPSVNNQRERFLSKEEAALLLAELKKGSQTTYETALLALHTGMRASEIFNLKPSDLDFENGIISIRDSKNKTPGICYMTDEVKRMLKNKPFENGLVFNPRIHAKGQITRVSGFFQRTADRLFNKGIADPRQRVVFHSLRHSFGSWLATQGTPLLTIKELMRHKTIQMTLRYAHLSPSVKQQAIADLQKNFIELKAQEKRGKEK